MIVIGHRGAKGLAPENTLASMFKAVEHGVDEIEFDVRVTKDSRVILSHETYITDAAGYQFTIASNSFTFLKQHKPDLTQLEEVLDSLGHKVPLIIEIKPGEKLEPIIAILRHRLHSNLKNTDILIASFDQNILRKMHREFPDIQIVINESWSGVRAVYRARQVNTKRLTMNKLWLWSGFISGMKHRGYRLVAYTLNDTVKAKKWAVYGIYGVVTDYPDRFESKYSK